VDRREARNPRRIVATMGKVLTEEGIARQLANSLRETNDRLDRLIAEQQRTNELLEMLSGLIVLAPDSPVPGKPAVRTSSVARRIELE
jgi:hypothetical protein